MLRLLPTKIISQQCSANLASPTVGRPVINRVCWKLLCTGDTFYFLCSPHWHWTASYTIIWLYRFPWDCYTKLIYVSRCTVVEFPIRSVIRRAVTRWFFLVVFPVSLLRSLIRTFLWSNGSCECLHRNTHTRLFFFPGSTCQRMLTRFQWKYLVRFSPMRSLMCHSLQGIRHRWF